MHRTKVQKKYVGIDNETNGGMTDTAKIIRDAWIFGFIPETETCEGWLAAGLQTLWDQTSAEWEKYGYLASNLPEDLRERFDRIQAAALERAKASGEWDPEHDVNDEG